MTPLITPVQKDAVLSILFDNINDERDADVGYAEFIHILNVGELESVIYHFERLGLVQTHGNLRSEQVYVHIRPEADQFIQRGGFYGQEVLFQQSVEVLLSELEKAKPLFTEQAEKVASAIGNVSSFLALIHQITAPK